MGFFFYIYERKFPSLVFTESLSFCLLFHLNFIQIDLSFKLIYKLTFAIFSRKKIYTSPLMR